MLNLDPAKLLVIAVVSGHPPGARPAATGGPAGGCRLALPSTSSATAWRRARSGPPFRTCRRATTSPGWPAHPRPCSATCPKWGATGPTTLEHNLGRQRRMLTAPVNVGRRWGSHPVANGTTGPTPRTHTRPWAVRRHRPGRPGPELTARTTHGVPPLHRLAQGEALARQRLTLGEHLGELRYRLVVSVIAFAIAAIVAAVLYEPILDFLIRPAARSARPTATSARLIGSARCWARATEAAPTST